MVSAFDSEEISAMSQVKKFFALHIIIQNIKTFYLRKLVV